MRFEEEYLRDLSSFLDGRKDEFGPCWSMVPHLLPSITVVSGDVRGSQILAPVVSLYAVDRH